MYIITHKYNKLICHKVINYKYINRCHYTDVRTLLMVDNKIQLLTNLVRLIF